MFGFAILLLSLTDVLQASQTFLGPEQRPEATTLNSVLTEDDYQAVAGMRSDDMMKVFVRKLLESTNREIRDESELSGFVPHYSGTIAVQSLDRMLSELQTVNWVVPVPAASRNSHVRGGRGAPLTEEGYQLVAALRNDEYMKVFIRRLARVTGHWVQDEGALSGFVPHYSGTLAVQSIDKLKEELKAAPWVVPLPTRDDLDDDEAM